MLSATSPTALPTMPPLQSRPSTMATATAGLDSDGDRDNDARESASAQAAEQRSAVPSLPSDPSRGRTLNITA